MELQLQHLCKHYGTKCAVNHVSTTLTPGVYGLLGANGAGKTTLMRMICGVLKPTSGRLCLDRKSIEELGEAKNRTEELLELVNLRDVADRKIKFFSGGMKQRLGIAQAELNAQDILILDEPTADLTLKSVCASAI